MKIRRSVSARNTSWRATSRRRPRASLTPTRSSVRTAKPRSAWRTTSRARWCRRSSKPGGRLLSLDFNRPSFPPLRVVYLAYLTVVGSTVGWALHGDPDTYRYIPESIKRYPGAEAVVGRLRDAGFREARWEPVLGGLMAIHVAKK